MTFGTLLIADCVGGADSVTDKPSAANSSTTVSSSAEAVKEQSKGQELTETLPSTSWQGTEVYDRNNNDLATGNVNLTGLTRYNGEAGFYELFDKETGKACSNEGTFLATGSDEKHILISDT